MFIKGLAAAAVLAAGLGLAADDAAAKTRVFVGVGVPFWGAGYGYGYEPYPPYYSYYNPGYYRYGYNYAYPYNSYGYGYYKRPRVGYRVTCRDARRMLQRNGYRDVNSRDCGGSTYGFTAWKNGRAYRIAVSARSGTVVSRRRI